MRLIAKAIVKAREDGIPQMADPTFFCYQFELLLSLPSSAHSIIAHLYWTILVSKSDILYFPQSSHFTPVKVSLMVGTCCSKSVLPMSHNIISQGFFTKIKDKIK